ncbi:hypothetical protein ACFW04_006032 [Cataglyphis niger]
MDRILKGIMKYRKCHREGMVKQFQQVRDHPEPKAVFFTCMDSRMIPTRFTETNVGDMFVGTTNLLYIIALSQSFAHVIAVGSFFIFSDSNAVYFFSPKAMLLKTKLSLTRCVRYSM